ncbi:MAG: DUF2145 domain-containing protein [Gammaproteobacteria bacterium]|nr:DUF2145 domain-containing protein [Gammaproteobacteria bacterium]
MPGWISRIALTAIVLLVTVNANAASQQAGGVMGYSAAQIAEFAKRVETDLAEKSAHVAIVSRVGRSGDELPDGIRYTHTGFAVYSAIQTADGRTVPGYVMYNLYQNQEKLNVSRLVRDYPFDFFSAVMELKAGVIIPTPKLQQRLLELIGSQTYTDLHNPRYSAISNPFDARYQNCTEFLLDVVNAAVYQTDDRAQVKARNQEFFKPQPIAVGPVQRFLGSLFSKEFAFSDHDGRVATATFTTIAEYMEQYGLAQDRFEITSSQAPSVFYEATQRGPSTGANRQRDAVHAR